MRAKSLWSIRNKSKRECYYWVFTVEDDIFADPWNGKRGKLFSGETVDIDIKGKKFQVGFREGKGWDPWVAKPVLVRTDRPVILTDALEIQQPEEVEFTDPNLVPTVNFFDNISWNNIARSIVVGLAEKIPKVGAAISALIGFIWPEEEDDVHDLIRESEIRMMKWVRGRIREYDFATLQQHLKGLRANFYEYSRATGAAERKRWIVSVLSHCNAIQAHFLKEDYVPGTISLASEVATMHLAILRERVVHHAEIYSDETVDLEHFKERLTTAIVDYQKFIVEVAIPGELTWRDDQIKMDANYVVRDWVTREVHTFGGSGRGATSPRPLADFHRAQAVNSYAITLQHNVADPAALWDFFDPDKADSHPIPLDRVIWMGPLSGLGYKYANEHNHPGPGKDLIDVGSGVLTSIEIYEHDYVDGLRFNFGGKSGTFLGSEGGNKQIIEIKEGIYLTGITTWWDYELAGIQFEFSDGTSSAKLGDRWWNSQPGLHYGERHGKHRQVARFPGHYISALRVGRRDGQARSGKGSGSMAAFVIEIGFTPLPTFYTDLLEA